MQLSNRVRLLWVVVGLISSNGCASFISGRDADVAIQSNPPQAYVTVQNEQGQTVATAMTPAKISLKRGNGVFRKAPRYTAYIEKPGFLIEEVHIDPKLNPWIFGNLVLGGPIGIAADTASGAIWRYTPDDIYQELTPSQGQYYSQAKSDAVTQTSYASDYED